MPTTAPYWIAAFTLLLLGLADLAREIGLRPSQALERARLARVIALLQEIEETLATGLVPEPARWSQLAELPAPWGALVEQSLRELRASGGAVLPTLKRLRDLAQEHAASLASARARAAQSLAQALACLALVPVFGSALWQLLPGVAEQPVRWAIACALAMALAGAGAAWMLAMAERARWGGLPPASRAWVLAAPCAGERFLALVRAGQPADLAWARAIELVRADAPGLAALWGSSVWRADADHSGEASGSGGEPSSIGWAPGGWAPARRPSASERVFAELGRALRKGVQVSLMEGRPCSERVETALAAGRQETRALVDRELSLLATRALQPLFTCVAPALLALLAYGLWLGWEQMSSGSGGAW